MIIFCCFIDFSFLFLDVRILRYYFVPPASSGWAYEWIICGRARVSVSVSGNLCVRVSGSLYVRLCVTMFW